MKLIGSLIAGIIGLVYILNPTGGMIEMIPDVMPIVGNLDEAGATLLIVNAYRVWKDRKK